MKKSIPVLIITAKGCSDCELSKVLIQRAAYLSNKTVVLQELDSESEEAVEKALLYNLTNIPAFVIRGMVFNEAEPSVESIVDALTINQYNEN